MKQTTMVMEKVKVGVCIGPILQDMVDMEMPMPARILALTGQTTG